MRRKSVINHFDQLCVNAAGKPKEFWNSLRPLMHSKRCVPSEYITLKENNKIIKDQNQVAEILNSYFKNVTESLNIQQHTSFENQPHLSNIPKNWNQDEQFEFNLINHELVKTALQRMKANKATGHDHIPPLALKASIPTITRPLSHLINTIITLRAVPDSWKRGEIVPQHKKDSQLEKENIRPVTVLPAMSKIFGHLIHQQLSVHLEKILYNSMFGYRKYHGCPTALLAFTEQWKEDLDNHNIIGTVAIDLSKAFDCLLHDLIPEKLKFYGVGDQALSLMRSYLSSRHQSEAWYCFLHVGRGIKRSPSRLCLGTDIV